MVTILELFSNFEFSRTKLLGMELFVKTASLKSVSKSQSIELALFEDVDDKDDVSLLKVEDVETGDVLYFLIWFFLDVLKLKRLFCVADAKCSSLIV